MYKMENRLYSDKEINKLFNNRYFLYELAQEQSHIFLHFAKKISTGNIVITNLQIISIFDEHSAKPSDADVYKHIRKIANANKFNTNEPAFLKILYQ